ncbi:uncharacterized protein LOC142182203 [Nicotiana tabacum]|uniref:Uncharacterized protein LOC142182203 n=1 Tax=Nicotiana tabacum TaxID=4097 RepID=A0AC58US80_TOBAC
MHHFESLFNLPKPTLNPVILNFILNCISEEENINLTAIPSKEEIKEAVFNLSTDSTTGPDGYIVLSFNIAEILSIDAPTTFSEFRPISLSNFTNKIISKVLSLRLKPLLTKLISDNQTGFVKDRLKARDPLSSSLFILTAEVLSRSLNNLNRNNNFIPFSMPSRGPTINYLAYADDVVIFSSGSRISINIIMKVIRDYEESSSQLVNRDKSFFLTAPKTRASRINRMRQCIGFLDKDFPITYLGCPLYAGRKKIAYFDNIVHKVIKRLNGWQGNILSPGGRMVLIKNVLQSLLIYTHSPCSLLKIPFI